MNSDKRTTFIRKVLEDKASMAMAGSDVLRVVHIRLGARLANKRSFKLPAAIAIGVLATLVVATGALAWPTIEKGSTVFAGWSADPDAVATGLIAASGQCRSWDDERPPVKVIDQRGDVGMVVVAGDRSEGYCLFYQEQPQGAWIAKGGGSSGGTGDDSFQPPVHVEGVASLRMVEELGRYVSSVRGRVSPDVATVVVRRRGKPAITAALQNGYFIAWWPEGWLDSVMPWPDLADIRDITIEAYGEDGSLAARLDGIWSVGSESWDGSK